MYFPDGADTDHVMTTASAALHCSRAEVPGQAQTGKGNAEDMLRLVLVYCLTSTQLPSGPEFEKLEAALQEAGADLAALAYVRRMRRMKLTGDAPGLAPAWTFETV